MSFIIFFSKETTKHDLIHRVPNFIDLVTACTSRTAP